MLPMDYQGGVWKTTCPYEARTKSEVGEGRQITWATEWGGREGAKASNGRQEIGIIHFPTPQQVKTVIQ